MISQNAHSYAELLEEERPKQEPRVGSYGHQLDVKPKDYEILRRNSRQNNHDLPCPVERSKKAFNALSIINVMNRSLHTSHPNISTHHTNCQEVGMATNPYGQSQKTHILLRPYVIKAPSSIKREGWSQKWGLGFFQEEKHHTRNNIPKSAQIPLGSSKNKHISFNTCLDWVIQFRCFLLLPLIHQLFYEHIPYLIHLYLLQVTPKY